MQRLHLQKRPPAMKRLGIDPVIHLNNPGGIKKGRMLADFAVRAYELKVAAIVSPVMA